MRVNADEVKKRLLKVLVEVSGVKESKITLESTIRNDLTIDSLDKVYLINELEEEFGINIDDLDVQSFKIVEDYLNYLIERSERR